jgi:hypothetical protein
MSVVPPAAKGTKIRIGRLGKAGAWAKAGAASPAAKSPKLARRVKAGTAFPPA